MKKDKEEKPKMYIASCSFGKDSMATILLALEHNEPLDGVVFSEVMFDHEKGISGEKPEHIEWIYKVAIPKLESMGVKVDVVRAKTDYKGLFNTAHKIGVNKGLLYGFQSSRICFANSTCKIQPIRSFLADKRKKYDLVEYIGIAIDEPNRLKRLNGVNKISLLAKYNYTEQMAKDKCIEYDLLSPCYQEDYVSNGRGRNGCWFCPNSHIRSYCRIRKLYPHLWQELRELDASKNRSHPYFKYGKTLQEVEREMDAYELNEKIQLSLF